MPDFSISTTFVVRPDEQLALLQIGRRQFQVRRRTTLHWRRSRHRSSRRSALTRLDPEGSYFKFNLDYISFYHLIRLEDSRSLKLIYEKRGTRFLRAATET